jgi:hypothetical protein
MRLNLKHAAAMAATAGVLGAAAVPALAASKAGSYNLTYSSGGAAVPVGTSWTSSGGSLSFLNKSGAVIATCTGSSLSGVTGTTNDGPSNELSVTGGSYTGCTTAGSPVYVTVNASSSSPWNVIPTSGSASPFKGEVTGINVTVRCGSPSATPATYSGNLTKGVSEQNAKTGSVIGLKDAASLAKSGSGCPTLPNPAYVTQSNTLQTVGGNPVTKKNNLWLNAG